MGKKSSKKNKSRNNKVPATATPSEILSTLMPMVSKVKDLEPDDDNAKGNTAPTFVENGKIPTLVPTKIGKERLDEVRLRRSKKFSGKVEDIVKSNKPYADYSPNDAIRMLDDAIDKVRDGKYKKALENREKSLIEDLTDAFMNMDADLPNFQRTCSAINKLLRVGKSFYEYGDQKEYITNILYDRILAKYLGYGFTEPSGYTPSGKTKTKIKYPLLHNNMNKSYAIRSGEQIPEGVKETTKVEDWLIKAFKTLGISSEAEVTLELSPKIDGVSVNGTIHSGEKYDILMDPQTRGDEEESVCVIGMNNIQLGNGSAENDFGIQVEVFVTNEDAKAAAEYLKLKRPYVSNRHAAAGILNRLCTREDDDLLPFLSIYPIEASGLDSNYEERMDFLSNFSIVPDDMIERKKVSGNLSQLIDKIEKHFEKLAKKREEISYAIDGMVITFVDDDYQKVLGRNGRTNQYQLGLKFDPANAIAEVEGIHLDTGKKGFRTIQVDLKHPVFLDGVRYDHVPVLSAGLYDELDLCKGSKVNVHRVGDVIPSISMVKKGDGKKLKLPNKCPDCGHEMRVKNKKLYCDNPDCAGNLAGVIMGFIDGIGMTGYADSFADDLINEVGVKSLADVINLTKGKLEKAGMAGKIEKQFPSAMNKALAEVEDYKILGSIGIPDIGPARAKDILCKIGGWEALVHGFKDGDKANDVCMRKLIGYLPKDAAAAIISDTVTGAIEALGGRVKNVTKKFDNLRLGHTGVTPGVNVTRICKELDIDIVDGKSFDMLITGSKDSNSDKMQIAKKKGLPVYTEIEFIERYQNGTVYSTSVATMASFSGRLVGKIEKSDDSKQCSAPFRTPAGYYTAFGNLLDLVDF